MTHKYPKKDNEKFTQDDLLKIHYNYLNLGWEAQGVMVKNPTTVVSVHLRKKVDESNTYKHNKTEIFLSQLIILYPYVCLLFQRITVF